MSELRRYDLQYARKRRAIYAGRANELVICTDVQVIAYRHLTLFRRLDKLGNFLRPQGGALLCIARAE